MWHMPRSLVHTSEYVTDVEDVCCCVSKDSKHTCKDAGDVRYIKYTTHMEYVDGVRSKFSKPAVSKF